MASDIIPPGAQPPEAQPPQWTSPYETAIVDRLQQTRRQVKVVDLGVGLLVLGVVTLTYLLAATLLDQWIVRGGLGFGGRLLLFLGLVSVMGYIFARRILPLLVYKINPLFAAQTIEQSRPSLKNSLINFLFLRQHRQEVTRSVLDQRIYEGLEHTAAVELTHVPAETVVDRQQVIRLGYLLAGVLAIVCLYLILSPKNPLVSFSRVIWPWADIQAPSRVTITALEPGDTVAFQGDTLTISAEIQGLRDGETVTLYYTTADKQSVNQAIPMTVPDKDYRYQCELPPDPAGLQQNVTYYLQAGDAKTRRFTIDVQTALAILVDRVEYDYPGYTGVADTSVKGTGDIRAVEGTKVTIHATANQEIDRAVLEMNCDPRNVLAMKVEGRQATGQIRLMMDSNDPLRPKYDSYQIRFRDRYSHENRRPIRHQIDVIRDQPPEIQLVDAPPKEVEIQVPVNGSLDLKVRAQDPDYGLRRVALRAEHTKTTKSLPIPPLLENRSPEKAHQGPLEASHRFEPAKLGLKAGDKVIYWAEARDNKEPEPNRSETERREITIAPEEAPQQEQQAPKDDGQGNQQPPDGQQPPDQPQQDQGAKGQQDGPPGEKQKPNDPSQERSNDQNQKGQADQPSGQDGQGDSSDGQGSQSNDSSGRGSNEQKGEPSQSGNEGQGEESGKQGKSKSETGQKGEPQSGQGAEQPREPIDPNSPGDAFEEILKHREKQQSKQDQNAQPKPDQGQQPKGEPKSDQPQTGQEAAKQQPNQQGADPTREPKEGQKPPAGEPKSGTEKPSSKSADKSQDGQGKGQEAGGESDLPQKPDGRSQGQGGKEGQEKPPSDGPQSGEGQQAGKGSLPKAGHEKPSGEQGPQDGDDPSGTEETAQGPSKDPTGKAQRVPDSGQQGTPKPGERQKPESGQGAQTKPGESAQEKPSVGPEKPEAKGGDPKSFQGEGMEEKATGENAGSPSPQESNQPRQQKSPDQTASGEDQGESGKSPSTSKKQSNSNSDAPGDRSGGGDEGGGQKAKQKGTGGAGSHTESEQGANDGQQSGKGEIGEKPGDQAKADRPTGSQSAKDQGQGSGQRKHAGENSKDAEQLGSGGESSSEPSGGQPQGTSPDGRGQQAGRSSPTGGQPGNQESRPAEPAEPEPIRPDEVNRKYAEEAVDLSLETLEEQLAKDKPDPELLDRLGWSRDELEQFYRQWSDMRRAAGQKGSAGEAAKQEWTKALDSLGLRSGSTEIRGGGPKDPLRGMKESRRVPPPPGWAEQFRAYTESVAGGKRGE